MKREIKFRVWEQNKKKMVYPIDTLKVSNEEGYSHLEQFLDRGDLVMADDYDIKHYKKLPCIMMQYTGIKDVDGKEIYEDDIINGMTVTYCGDQNGGLGMACGWYLQQDDFERWIELESKCNANGDNHKIDGNVHENPELLKS